jgi:hypothetical protein
MDAPRETLEAGRPSEEDESYIAYNVLVADVSADLGWVMGNAGAAGTG